MLLQFTIERDVANRAATVRESVPADVRLRGVFQQPAAFNSETPLHRGHCPNQPIHHRVIRLSQICCDAFGLIEILMSCSASLVPLPYGRGSDYGAALTTPSPF